MNKEAFYRIVIVALLVLNFGILGYLWIGAGHRPPEGHRQPAGFIIEKLQLDAGQQQQFQQLRDKHHAADIELRMRSKDLHDALFSLLKNDVIDSNAVDSLQLLIAGNDRAKEQLNFNHFKELKNLLKPQQQQLYKEFIEEIARQFGPPPLGHRP